MILQAGGSARAGEAKVSGSLLHERWKAFWIDVPGQPRHEFGVYLFRKDFELKSVPGSLVINVSADNRYKLFVNGTLVSLGPARGDVLHWRFETVDIAGYLRPGANVIAAIVWNAGEMHALAQVSSRTAFIVQANSSAGRMLNTDKSWKCVKDSGYGQLMRHVIGYYAASPGEYLDMNKTPHGWKEISFDDSGWSSAEQIFDGTPRGVYTNHSSGWMLVPSPIPPMEMKMERLEKVRETQGVDVPERFLSGDSPVTIPANSNATILLDQTHLTDAYPTIKFSGGRDAGIAIRYAETLYNVDTIGPDYRVNYYKTNRNDVAGKVFIGLKDSITSDGTPRQSFTSLWWREYRYVQIKVSTKSQPLTLNDFYGTRTGYPFKFNASFSSPDSVLQKIIQVGWRTARLCAFETYMDCPYYEQLQYIGDTRIQALVSYFDSGDHRLARNAIDLLDDSRLTSGITQSRYPSSSMQIIPPFSLWWIGMLHDYWMYTPDSSFVRSKLQGERAVLHFFHKYQGKNGSLKDTPYWNFCDWVNAKEWHSGMPPFGTNGHSSIMDMQLLWAYELAGQMENRLGMKCFATLYHERATQLKKTIVRMYWDGERGEFADTPQKESFSQHANALAILARLVSGSKAHSLGRKILNDTTLTQATIYFKYYVNRALVKAGYGNGYLNWLGVWKKNLEYGMTTWAETSDLKNNRSDCHGWGASPNIELLRTVLGIDSYAPGFNRVMVEPHPGGLKHLSGSIPGPYGEISASYRLVGGKWKIEIRLPAGVSGVFVWKGTRHALIAGENNFTFSR